MIYCSSAGLQLALISEIQSQGWQSDKYDGRKRAILAQAKRWPAFQLSPMPAESNSVEESPALQYSESLCQENLHSIPDNSGQTPYLLKKARVFLPGSHHSLEGI